LPAADNALLAPDDGIANFKSGTDAFGLFFTSNSLSDDSVMLKSLKDSSLFGGNLRPLLATWPLG
jgi:hypothetical protein